MPVMCFFSCFLPAKDHSLRTPGLSQEMCPTLLSPWVMLRMVASFKCAVASMSSNMRALLNPKLTQRFKLITVAQVVACQLETVI